MEILEGCWFESMMNSGKHYIVELPYWPKGNEWNQVRFYLKDGERHDALNNAIDCAMRNHLDVADQDGEIIWSYSDYVESIL